MARTAGDGWLFVGALGAAVAVAQSLGCDANGSDGGPDGATSSAVAEATDAYLARVGQGVILPSLRAFRVEVVSLIEAVEAWQSARGTTGEEAAREAAREAHANALLAWQVIEPMQVGSLGSSLTTLGGEDQRDTIYSWPTVNPCRVDQETGTGAYAEPDWADEAFVNVRGLDAIEYLLYVETAGNACPPQVAINQEGTWSALGDDGVWSARMAYAVVLAEDVLASTDGAIASWSADGADLSGALAAADGSGPWASPTEALDAVYDALFFVYKKGIDRKLGQPAGVVDCDAATCPDDVEARASGLSDQALLANLDGFRALFTGDVQGSEGAGLDDVLVAAGASDVVDDLLTKLDAAEQAIEALDAPFDEALAADAEEVGALYATAKAFADVVRKDVAPVLQLTVPLEAAGDND